MPFQMVVAVVFIALNTVDTVVLMLFTTVLIFVLMAVQILLMVVWMAFITEDSVEETALMALPTVVLMVSQMLVMVSPQFSQISWNGSVMISHAASSREPMNWMPTLTTFLMVSQASEKKVVIPFQMFVKVVDTAFHTSS